METRSGGRTEMVPIVPTNKPKTRREGEEDRIKAQAGAEGLGVGGCADCIKGWIACVHGAYTASAVQVCVQHEHFALLASNQHQVLSLRHVGLLRRN